MNIEFQKTGHEWDEKREKEYNSLTRRIERALVAIEKDLVNYKTKPTIENVSEISKCSKGALRDRAKKDKNNWPLSEIKRIQSAWRVIKNKNKPNVMEAGGDGATNQNRSARDTNPAVLAEVEGRVRKYMMENSRLIYELSEIKEISRQQAKSIESMDNRRKALEEENAELKQKLLNKKNSKLKVVK